MKHHYWVQKDDKPKQQLIRDAGPTSKLILVMREDMCSVQDFFFKKNSKSTAMSFKKKQFYITSRS
jgi:hypothetical protein